MRTSILDRYIGSVIASTVIVTLLVLVGLFSLFVFIEQLEVYGRGDYRLWAILSYVSLRLPRLCYDLFPLAGLIGTLLGLSLLARSGELAVMRCAGLSRGHIMLAVLKAGLIFVVCAMSLGEFIAPYATQFATNYRFARMQGDLPVHGETGLWLREGNTYINISAVTPDGTIRDVLIHEFDGNRELRTTTYAPAARFEGEHWVLQDVRQTRFGDGQIHVARPARANWNSRLTPDLITVFMTKPEMQSIWALARYIDYLRTNGQNTSPYEFALWTKLLYPLATGAMVTLAVPIVLSRITQRGGDSRYVILGTLIGIGFFLANKVTGNLGIIADLPPLLIAAGPTLLVAGTITLLLRRTC